MNKPTDLTIRKIEQTEINILEELLYELIYQADEQNLYSKDIIYSPRIYNYIDKFGQKKDDYCLVADLKGKIAGAVWVRILASEIKGYGNIDNETPEFAIALFKEYRNQGIGTLLMKSMISHLKENKYCQASLSVEKNNYAHKIYQKLGFEIIDENKEDYIMLLKL